MFRTTDKGLSRKLAQSGAELLPRGIRVNAVSLGAIEISILDKVMPKEALGNTYKQIAKSYPIKRVGNTEEIARAAVFLAFEATYTTGAELPCRWGWPQL